MDYYSKIEDDRKRNKSSRHDGKTDKHRHHTNGRHRDDNNDEENDYYVSAVSKRSRSRSRSKSRNTPTTKFQRHSNKHDEDNMVGPNPAQLGYGNNAQGYSSARPFNPGVPSRTIMLRQLPLQMEDVELRTEFNMLSVPYKDVRLVRNRETGQSRGFAFVEFNTVEEAQRWMNTTQGWILFSNYSNKVQLFYSHSGDDTKLSDSSAGARQALASDWDCSKCGIKNFKRRDRCFKCNISRDESDRRKGGDGYDHVGSTPCNTLLLRGLDALTSEETIMDILNRFAAGSIIFKNCHIARDLLTNVSCGFAFVEFNTIQDAAYLLQIIQPSIEIDGKQVSIDYSKNSFKTALTQLEIQSRQSYQSDSISYNNNNNNHHHHQVSKNGNQADQANSAAAVAQAAMLNMHKKQEIISHITRDLKQQSPMAISNSSALFGGTSASSIDSTVSANLQMLAKQADVFGKVYAPPDVTQFTYDQTSGYYYDYSTGFYYDAVSQYYFNSLTQQYMYWDHVNSTYVPVVSEAETAAAAAAATVTSALEVSSSSSTVIENSSNKTEEKSSVQETTKKQTKPVKTAAQIAKDMERWAESQNKKKDTTKKPQTSSSTVTSASIAKVVAVTQPTAFVEKLAMPESSIEAKKEEEEKEAPLPDETERLNEIKKPEKPEQNQQQSENGNDQAAKENSSSSTVVGSDDQSIHIDLNKMACLLCKRRFDSIEILNKHIAKSDLHKKNLEKHKKEKEEEKKEDDSLMAALQYRDRAKERRLKYGLTEPPSPPSPTNYPSTGFKTSSKSLDDESASFDSTATEKPTESIAAKLMRKMGWNDGSGLGKNLQGISAPIEATMRQKGAGLGATTYEMDPNDSYKDAARKSARARFESLS